MKNDTDIWETSPFCMYVYEKFRVYLRKFRVITQKYTIFSQRKWAEWAFVINNLWCIMKLN